MKKRSALVLKVSGIFILLLAVVYVLLLVAGSRSLRRAYADLEAAGRPMLASEVIPPDLPDAENAALIYQAAVLRLKAGGTAGQNLYQVLREQAAAVLANPADEESMKNFAARIRSPVVGDVLRSLEQASDMPGCQYSFDYDAGPAMLLPHIEELLVLSDILGAAASVRAAEGDAEAAWALTVARLRMANATKQDPILISQLVRNKLLKKTSDGLRDLCARTEIPEKARLDSVRLLKEFEDLDPMVRAMDSERLLLGEWVYRLPSSERLAALGDFKSFRVISPVYRLTAPWDHASYLKIMQIYAQNMTKPYHSSDLQLGPKMIDALPWYSTTSRMLIPALTATKREHLKMIAHARITGTGLELLAHRQRTGEFPEDLSALHPVPPQDPFSGEALQYRRTEGGFLLYSTGPNLQDDAGVHDTKEAKDDILWQYPG